MGILSKTHDLMIAQSMRTIGNLLPFAFEETIVDILRKRIDAEVPYPEGRDFLIRMLQVALKRLPSASKSCRKRVVETLLINSHVKGAKVRESLKNKLGYWAPYLFVISPSMRCNLNCYGCYAGEYNKSGVETDMSWELLDSVLKQAKDMGIYFIVISGGEPFVYPHFWRMLEEHNDMYFQCYTNGTLINEEAAKRLSKLGNLMPCISVEGYEKETDARRGKGHWKKVMRSYDNLRKEGVLFGFSATATRQNNELIGSEEFIDYFVEQGCTIGWYFNYIPIGRKPSFELIPTPEQRIWRRRQLAKLRMEKDIIIADFWCDGTLCGGCIAGGRHYFHVNNHGDVEPCVFAHFAKDNVKDKPLEEILDSDFFRSFRRRQPYVENLLRPCAIIDNPQVLRAAVQENKAYPTHAGAESIITEFAVELDKYAKEYGKVADNEWYENYLPSLSNEERKIFLDSIKSAKAENQKLFGVKRTAVVPS
jgi:MoaA/NifB/PqqE/SkfB family radical SAM enzyme